MRHTARQLKTAKRKNRYKYIPESSICRSLGYKEGDTIFIAGKPFTVGRRLC